MQIDTQLTENKAIKDHEFFVISQPLLQYGPLSLLQLKDLYVNEVIDDNSFIATNSSIPPTDDKQPFRLLPHETPIWSPIHSRSSIFMELEDATSVFSKTNRDKSDDNKSNETNPSNLKFQVNMNVNTNVPTMDINMNINANKHHNHSKLNPNNITRKEVESLKFELQLLEGKNKTLAKLNKDLQKEIATLNAKYQSQYNNLKQKMVKGFEDYKLQKKEQMVTLQSQLNHFRNTTRNALKNDIELKQIRKDSERLTVHNKELMSKHSKILDQVAAMKLALQFSKTQYKSLQSKYETQIFDYAKYQADIGALKEQILQKDNVMEHSRKVVNSLLKNTICDLIPHNQPLNEIEGSHDTTTTKHSIDRSIIRLDALKISELLSWHNYSTKFHLSMDLLSEYELTSRRSRSRMKNVVFMLGEKVKMLNIHNLNLSELIHLSRDLKQSFDVIASEQHLKEYELANQRKEFMKHKPMPQISRCLSPMMTPIMQTGSYLCEDTETEALADHHYGISFGSMTSLSMLDIQTLPDHFTRNTSLHSLSPSLDETESIIYKHRTKSGSIKGSGLKLLTDQDTLKSYLEPKQKKNVSRSRQTNNRRNHNISRSLSHQNVTNKKPNKRYNHYSAFRKNGRRQHNKNSSISSISQSHSVYGYHELNPRSSAPLSGRRKDNASMTSLSALSVINGKEEEEEEDEEEEEEEEEEGNDKETEYNSDLAIDESQEHDDKITMLLNNKVLSNDILSFFAM